MPITRPLQCMYVYICVSRPLLTKSILNEVLLIAELCWDLLSKLYLPHNPTSCSPSLLFSSSNLLLYLCHSFIALFLTLSLPYRASSFFSHPLSFMLFEFISTGEMTHRRSGKCMFGLMYVCICIHISVG